jgi:hypothetical protein
MARRVVASVHDFPPVRSQLRAKWLAMAARYPARVEAEDGGCFVMLWDRQVESLDAGQPLDVGGWQLSLEVRRFWSIPATGRVRVHPDNRIETLEGTS